MTFSGLGQEKFKMSQRQRGITSKGENGVILKESKVKSKGLALN